MGIQGAQTSATANLNACCYKSERAPPWHMTLTFTELGENQPGSFMREQTDQQTNAGKAIPHCEYMKSSFIDFSNSTVNLAHMHAHVHMRAVQCEHK